EAIEIRDGATAREEIGEELGVEDRAGHLQLFLRRVRRPSVLGDKKRHGRGQAFAAPAREDARVELRRLDEILARVTADVVDRVPLEGEEVEARVAERVEKAGDPGGAATRVG